ncbi:hypothetical protein VPH35_066106 [Triticum aestivum]|uniref:Serine/threonine-protein kinase n=1 Tax=Triticum turgidum subsp. durum TaxID=4567 RepID=A0A9R0SC59_TRITD|nr:unnamed protein product [Triticum turgidum subsp. durum]
MICEKRVLDVAPIQRFDLSTQVLLSRLNPMQVFGAVGFQNKRLGIPKEVIPLVASIISSCRDNDPSKQPSFYQLLSSLKKLQWLHCYRKPMTICECCLCNILVLWQVHV